ncbi:MULTISPECIES: hypothetical protein [Nonomuraea]|uniref:Cytochrome C biogenesis protein transmembrane region n=1 Tax=Nonomuraea ferruginea TaxID=46174 RepID=A0ABT4T6T3_9ACTN|nr:MULTISPECIES: hypothetical protein [Nonomuraea]MDA0645060.1 hypothetical protein [Nonomuraea ferruginea]TXK40181.1 hypothetical protein FR742_11760 [Nonomuraea sp. C10]
MALTEQRPAERAGIRHPWRAVLISSLIGFLLTVVWSAEFVDSVIGENVAGTVLGQEPEATVLDGILPGIVFAFATGLGGTFTACNIAVLGALCPIVGQPRSLSDRVGAVFKPLAWLTVGMLTVSGVYGAVVGIVGTAMPQFSTAPTLPGELSARSVQSMVAFGVIGLAFVWLGLAALGIVRDPLARLTRRFPNAPMVVMGALIGGFLIGRPYGLFRQLFRDAAESHNPLYGALAFMLQSVGNIVILTVLFVLLAVVMGGRVQGWFAARPGRLALITGAAFIVVGVFTFLYWDVRLLARRELIPWYPVIPW